MISIVVLFSCEQHELSPKQYDEEKIIHNTTIVSDEYMLQSMEHLIFQQVISIEEYSQLITNSYTNPLTIEPGLIFWMDTFTKQWFVYDYNQYKHNKGSFNGSSNILMDTLSNHIVYHLEINNLQFSNSENNITYSLNGSYYLLRNKSKPQEYDIHSECYTSIGNKAPLKRIVNYNINISKGETSFKGDTTVDGEKNIGVISKTRYSESFNLSISYPVIFKNCNGKILPGQGKWKITGIPEPIHTTFGLKEGETILNPCDSEGYKIKWNTHDDFVELFINY